MKKLKRQLISDVQNLDMNSKIEFFNYMVSHDIAFMENTNGVFFSIADISDEILDKLNEKLIILQKFQIHKSDSDELIMNNEFDNEIRNNSDIIIDSNSNEQLNNVQSDKQDNLNKEIFTKKVINEYNEILKDMECKNSKMNKKHSIYIKYSIAKKKYNKQFGSHDNKKIENFYLNELEEEKYIF